MNHRMESYDSDDDEAVTVGGDIFDEVLQYEEDNELLDPEEED